MMWKDIHGFEGYYQVSEYGDIKRLESKGCVRERIIKTHKNGRGYYFARLCVCGNGKMFAVHRLVAEAFVLNPEKLPVVDHIDRDQTNNHYTNLRWLTQSDNMRNTDRFDIANKKKIQRKENFLSKKTSKYIGVNTWDNNHGNKYFIASVQITTQSGCIRWRKYFKNEIDAAIARDEFILFNRDKYTIMPKLNFGL